MYKAGREGLGETKFDNRRIGNWVHHLLNLESWIPVFTGMTVQRSNYIETARFHTGSAAAYRATQHVTAA